MSADDTASLLYLVLLGLAIGGWMMASGRKAWGLMAQHAAIWGFIFLGAIAIAGLWGDVRSAITPQQQVAQGQIIAPRAADSHFYLRLGVNGTEIPFVVDTGATEIVLSQEDARRAGLDPSKLAYLGRANTANGVVRTAPVRLDRLTLGPYEDTNVRAYVTDGEMRGSLLGMGYLRRFTSLTIEGDRMILSR